MTNRIEGKSLDWNGIFGMAFLEWHPWNGTLGTALLEWHFWNDTTRSRKLSVHRFDP